MRSFPTFAASLLLLACGAIQAEPAPDAVSTVAVMPFTGSGIDSSTLESFSSALGTKLVATGKFRVMERAQISAILREQGFQQSGACEGGECAVEVGKLLSVDRLVVGNVAHVGKIYTVTARTVNVSTGETLRSATRNGSTKLETVLTRAIPNLAKDLAGLPAPTDKEIGEDTSHWGWWLAGGAVVAGGATVAAVLLTADKGASTAHQDETIKVVMP